MLVDALADVHHHRVELVRGDVGLDAVGERRLARDRAIEAHRAGHVLAHAVLTEVDALEVAHQRAHARGRRRALDAGGAADQRARFAVAQRLALQAGRGDRVLRCLDQRLVELGVRPLIAVLVALAQIRERDVVVLDVAVAIDEPGEDHAAGVDHGHAHGRARLHRDDLLAVDHHVAVELDAQRADHVALERVLAGADRRAAARAVGRRAGAVGLAALARADRVVVLVVLLRVVVVRLCVAASRQAERNHHEAERGRTHGRVPLIRLPDSLSGCRTPLRQLCRSLST